MEEREENDLFLFFIVELLCRAQALFSEGDLRGLRRVGGATGSGFLSVSVSLFIYTQKIISLPLIL